MCSYRCSVPTRACLFVRGGTERSTHIARRRGSRLRARRTPSLHRPRTKSHPSAQPSRCGAHTKTRLAVRQAQCQAQCPVPSLVGSGSGCLGRRALASAERTSCMVGVLAQEDTQATSRGSLEVVCCERRLRDGRRLWMSGVAARGRTRVGVVTNSSLGSQCCHRFAAYLTPLTTGSASW